MYTMLSGEPKFISSDVQELGGQRELAYKHDALQLLEMFMKKNND